MSNKERWDAYFLDLCLCTAKMSKDPNTQVGAVIVGPDNEVRSTGFNGLPRGIADSADRLSNRETKLKLIVHAEMNAVLAAARVGTPLRGCTLYLTATDGNQVWGGPPCTRCTVELLQAGIARVVSRPRKSESWWSDDLTLAGSLLAEAGVDYREVDPNCIVHDFSAPKSDDEVPF